MGDAMLTADSFRPHLQQTFALAHPGGSLELTLIELTELGMWRDRNGFSLIFAGPLQPIVPQATYRIENEALGPLDIFLVPLGPQNGVCQYQAVFI